MVHALYRALYRRAGKTGAIDPDVPATALAGDLVRRATWLVRGVVVHRHVAFVGPHVRVRGRRRLELGRGATLEPHCRIDAVSRDGVRLGPRAKLGAGTVVSVTSHLSRVGATFVMGRDSSCGEWCYFGASGGIRIGDDVIMGQMVTFHAQQHRHDDVDVPIREQGTSEAGIEIGDGCWIGAKATFLDGASVGRDSIVAAGAVVRGRHPARVVLAGVPATVVRTR